MKRSLPQVKIKINGDRWLITVVTPRILKKQVENGDQVAGLCVATERTIFIDHEHVNLETIMHELFHAYCSYLYLDDTNELSLADLEEIHANFFCNKAAEILKKANSVTKKLQKGML